ncbi:right-handed parallel beta-helix repeat-containing protein [Roseimarinus sediminis]|uniref:right-handed parallel beta-helix repeat-containing protein n=1 Tax=Roseimarinus sediminis TaxID=1610899 RepID=UPI003D1E5958
MTAFLKTYSLCLLFFVLNACNFSDSDLFSGDILLTEIENKTNYLAPLIIQNNDDETVRLNGKTLTFEQGRYELNEAGFYELTIGNDETIRFVLLDEERGETEWGLKKWIPATPEFQTELPHEVLLFHPANYVPGLKIPLVVQLENHQANQAINAKGTANEQRFLLKNGAGSIQLDAIEGQIKLLLGGQTISKTLGKAAVSLAFPDQVISGDIVIPENETVQITNDLIITASGSLTIEAGAILLLDEGVNIYNQGPVHINGTIVNPVWLSCSASDAHFGGFISTGANAAITAKHTFFTNFAQHAEAEYQYGHARHQALFRASDTRLSFTNCYFMDTPGQVFYPERSQIEIENCLIQRAKTGGQINASELTINNSYFSDFPDDSQNYRNEDNDALYISGSSATISHSVFMYAKDDGIDSGGSEGGKISISGCRIEACFHEGLALSSTNPAVKTHTIINTTVSNCQQGIELGYSSSQHEVYIENCHLNNNYIGIRYGDSYEWSVMGTITVSSSNLDANEKASWNMLRQSWTAAPDHLIFE